MAGAKAKRMPLRLGIRSVRQPLRRVLTQRCLSGAIRVEQGARRSPLWPPSCGRMHLLPLALVKLFRYNERYSDFGACAATTSERECPDDAGRPFCEEKCDVR